MILRTDTPIHYFIKDESNADWHAIYTCSYLEIPQNDGTSNFRQLEKIWLFISAKHERNDCTHFIIEFGRNDVMYSGHKNLQQLVAEKTRDAPIYNFKVATEEQYLALRQKAFDIYLKHPHLDFNRLKVGDEI